MSVDLFAGIPVSDYAAALAWYERLLGSPPAFLAHETEAVWEVAEHRFVYVDPPWATKRPPDGIRGARRRGQDQPRWPR